MENQNVQPTPLPSSTQKVANPFWYRENASYLFGVTATNSNAMLGIEDIQLRPASVNQRPYGILYSGLLKTICGSIAFQIRLSKSQAPFVQTISTENGVDEQGQKKYFEHIIFKPAVKAQILRFMEALLAQPAQAPVAPNPYFNPAVAQNFVQQPSVPAIDYNQYVVPQVPTAVGEGTATEVKADDLPI